MNTHNRLEVDVPSLVKALANLPFQANRVSWGLGGHRLATVTTPFLIEKMKNSAPTSKEELCTSALYYLRERRAEAVAKAISIAGAPRAKVEAISFGKEKPKADGHDESAWAKNRRVDIRYSDEP